MADDWQPGDLALCVRDGIQTRAGRCYVVSEVKLPGEIRYGTVNNFDHVLLRFVGLTPRAAWDWAGEDRFRKIRPHTPDAEDAETIRLLTGAPVRQPEGV